MADEATETAVRGGEPGPAGDPTPPAIPDGEGEPKAAGQNEGEGVGPTDEAEDGAAESADAEKDPERRWKRRVDKLTARSKEAEEENARLKEELEGMRSEREKRELADLQGLPVLPEALTRDERAAVKALRPQLDDAKRGAQFYWAKGEEDGCEVNGRSYTAAECREFARRYERESARLEARLGAIMDSGRGRLSALLKKHGAELLGEDKEPEPKKAPPPPKPAPQKAPPPSKTPERAPGGGVAPSGKDGAGKPPPTTATQEQLEAAFAFL